MSGSIAVAEQAVALMEHYMTHRLWLKGSLDRWADVDTALGQLLKGLLQGQIASDQSALDQIERLVSKHATRQEDFADALTSLDEDLRQMVALLVDGV